MTEKPILFYEVLRVIDHIPLFLENHRGRSYHYAIDDKVLNPGLPLIRGMINLYHKEIKACLLAEFKKIEIGMGMINVVNLKHYVERQYTFKSVSLMLYLTELFTGNSC